jgi:hypothetical protein
MNGACKIFSHKFYLFGRRSDGAIERSAARRATLTSNKLRWHGRRAVFIGRELRSLLVTMFDTSRIASKIIKLQYA